MTMMWMHFTPRGHLPSGRLSWLLIRLKGPKSMCGLIDGHIIIKLDWINQMTTVNGLLFIVMHFWPVKKFVFVLFNASFSVHENNLLPSNACVRLKSIIFIPPRSGNLLSCGLIAFNEKESNRKWQLQSNWMSSFKLNMVSKSPFFFQWKKVS